MNGVFKTICKIAADLQSSKHLRLLYNQISMVKISVLMLSWNTSACTVECLKSFKGQTLKDFEIIIVDNGSTLEDYEDLRNSIRKINLPIKLHRLEENQGICGGMNFAYGFAKGKYIIFMNNDMIVDDNLLKELVEPFSKYEGVGLTVPRINLYDGKKTQTCQFSGGRLSFYGTLIDRDAIRFGSQICNKEREVYCATGACFMVSRNTLDNLGEVFPNLYHIYFEDIDLSWRIRSAGYRMMYSPKAVAYHKGSVTTEINNVASTRFRYIVRNKYLTFWRNLRKKDFCIVFPFLLTFDIFRLVKNISKGQLNQIKEFLIGFKWFLLNLNNIKKPRKGRLSDLGWDFENIGSILSNWNKR